MKPTSVDEAMERIAVVDLLRREGYTERIVDKVDRAMNSHAALVEALRDAREAVVASRIDQVERGNAANANYLLALTDRIDGELQKADEGGI